MTPPRTAPEAMTGRELSRAFRALGHPNRLAIVRALLSRAAACCTDDRADDCLRDAASCNVSDLTQLVDIAPSTLSHHLKELEDSGVIERARDGRFLYCRVNRETMDRLATVLRGEDTPDEEQAA